MNHTSPTDHQNHPKQGRPQVGLFSMIKDPILTDQHFDPMDHGPSMTLTNLGTYLLWAILVVRRIHMVHQLYTIVSMVNNTHGQTVWSDGTRNKYHASQVIYERGGFC